MFTGIIADQGVVLAHQRGQLVLRTRLARKLRVGNSVAVAGVCLSVVKKTAKHVVFQIVPQTYRRTTFKQLRVGDKVNLEPAVRVGDALDGHFVLGHVDGVVRVAALQRLGDDALLICALPKELRPLVAVRGSVALQGVALTVAAVKPGNFQVALIPLTRQQTTLGKAVVGDELHVEVDVLARYLFQMKYANRK